MSDNLCVKEQFNKQAANFDKWYVTQDEKIFHSLYRFFEIKKDCHLLDVACGTGAFALYAARRIDTVRGVDISEGMIKIAVERGRQLGLRNIEFSCCDVERIPYPGEQFDNVVSKSAFHHMKNYKTVFGEMKRCCKPLGLIGLEDISAYGDRKVDGYFEELEYEIDKSHHLTLSKKEIIDIYKRNNVSILYLFESISELNFYDYVGHAVQAPGSGRKIDKLVKKGLGDNELSKWFVTKNDTLFWKRKVLTILGRR